MRTISKLAYAGVWVATAETLAIEARRDVAEVPARNLTMTLPGS